MALAAGQLDQRITLQRRVDGTNTLGQQADEWEDLPTRPQVWAGMRAAGGREFHRAGQQQATLDAVFIIRARADVDETMRIVWGSKYFEIVAPPVSDDGERMELICTSGVRGGR